MERKARKEKKKRRGGKKARPLLHAIAGTVILPVAPFNADFILNGCYTLGGSYQQEKKKKNQTCCMIAFWQLRTICPNYTISYFIREAYKNRQSHHEFPYA